MRNKVKKKGEKTKWKLEETEKILHRKKEKKKKKKVTYFSRIRNFIIWLLLSNSFIYLIFNF